MKKLDSKGGIWKAVLILALLGATGYTGYVYLWPMVDKSETAQTVASQVTPTPTAAVRPVFSPSAKEEAISTGW